MGCRDLLLFLLPFLGISILRFKTASVKRDRRNAIPHQNRKTRRGRLMQA